VKWHQVSEEPVKKCKKKWYADSYVIPQWWYW
jgi:hypothetical protein